VGGEVANRVTIECCYQRLRCSLELGVYIPAQPRPLGEVADGPGLLGVVSTKAEFPEFAARIYRTAPLSNDTTRRDPVNAKLIERCSDCVEDQGAEAASWGRRSQEPTKSVLGRAASRERLLLFSATMIIRPRPKTGEGVGGWVWNAYPLAGIARSLGGAGAFLLTGTYTTMTTGTLSAPIRS
jgi:hypothetical protein